MLSARSARSGTYNAEHAALVLIVFHQIQPYKHQQERSRWSLDDPAEDESQPGRLISAMKRFAMAEHPKLNLFRVTACHYETSEEAVEAADQEANLTKSYHRPDMMSK
jgi:hypothetical protein